MHSVRKRFGGLYWRLTISYFAVTLLAAVIVEIAVTLPASVQDYQIVQALPASIRDYQGRTVPSSPAPSGFSQFLGIFWDHFRVDGPYFILIASVVGTLTGLLITRNVTRRLRRITQAAEAWSKGEFAVEVRDPTRDEIGQLGQDLNGMADQLHTLLATREELAAIEERNRLARDLHDTVKQHVFTNVLLVRAARKLMDEDPQKARAYLADAEALGGQTQQELIALIQALRPATLEDRGLVAVLREYVTEWSSRADIAAELRAQGERSTPLDLEEALFRMAQEALANAARHSGARHVTVSLRWEDERVRLTVADDGKGFDAAHAKGRGLGLASMRERMTALGGMLEIASTALGTTIAAEAPLQSAAPAEQMEAARG